MVNIVGGIQGMIRGFRDGSFGDSALVGTGRIGKNEERWELYNRNWEFYRNTAFEDIRGWADYMDTRGMYEETRLIYNPMKVLVEFYVGRIYGGRLTADGADLPYAVRNAIPFTAKVDDALKGACAQVMEWSNWQVMKSPWIRLTAAMGNTLLEIVDDVEAGKTRLKIWPSTKVKDFKLNSAGNLEMYHLQYFVEDEDSDFYTYERKVTRGGVVEYRDGEVTSRTSTSYGFVPAVWCKHRDLGDDFGADVFDGDYIKLEELNSIATHGLDNLHKNIDPAIILWSDQRIGDALKKANAAESGGSETDEGWTYRAAKDIKLLRGGTGGKVEPMVGRLASDEVLKYIESIVHQIEKDHPELVYYDKLREMQYVSGPGARSLIGDTEANYLEVCANYDAALERALEMAVAIGGTRLAQGDGGWSNATEKQKKLAGFDLDSFAKDKLNVEIEMRPLLPWTIDDETAVKKGKAEVAVVIGDFVSKRKQLEEYGITDKAEQDKILEQMANEDMELVAGMSEAQHAGEPDPAPQGVDPNATANKTQTGKQQEKAGKK